MHFYVSLKISHNETVFVVVVFWVVLRFELRASFVVGIFEIESHELFAPAGFEP
jgi:hypothetical protein